MADIKKIIEEVKGMTVLQLNELVKAIEVEFGVSAQAAVVSQGAAPAAVAEEKTEFNVVLKDPGTNKIGVIKVVREITGLGLVEAKNMAEKGGVIKEGVTKDAATEMLKKFKDAGATAEMV